MAMILSCQLFRFLVFLEFLKDSAFIYVQQKILFFFFSLLPLSKTNMLKRRILQHVCVCNIYSRLCIAEEKDQERSSNMGRKRSKMYSSNHNILLVGEGDFSFSLSLATRFGSAPNIVATSLDSKEELVRKYSKAEENLNVLENLGCKILHGIDVHTMSKRACLKRKLFDRIVFNFPHAGFFYSERDARQIRLQQDLVRGFLRNAKKMLEEDGEIHITHKTDYPYDQWGIEIIAEEVGLFLKSQVPFHKDNYPGYVNKRGDGAKCNKTFPVGGCSTFKFKKSTPCA